MTIKLQDVQGRTFPYLRLSVTDVCNFSCTYCLPNGYKKTGCENKNLSVNEISHLVHAFAEMGTSKVRLTGGEPTTRRDFTDIARAIADIEGINKLAVTTNGYKLDERAQSFYDAGIRAINVSIDSLDPYKFHEITGHNRLAEVIRGIDKCLEIGFDSIKINAVLLKGFNDIELDQFLLYAKMKNVHIRFIELMRTGDNIPFFNKHHIQATDLATKLENLGWLEKLKESDSGPATEYIHEGYAGSMGVIAPYAKDFCNSCNRLRISSQGALQLCLFGDGRHDLRPLLQHSNQKEELKETVLHLLGHKKDAHFLHQNNYGITNNLASIGG